MPTLLSNFFVDYPYNYAIVDKSKFIKLLKRSINVKGSDFILIRPEILVNNLKLFVFALNRNDMIGLNIHHLHRFWSTIKPADVKIDDTTPIIIDVDGNSITESGFNSFVKIPYNNLFLCINNTRMNIRNSVNRNFYFLTKSSLR